MPPAPVNLSSVPMDFCRDIELSCAPIQTSKAAAAANRQEVYAAHYSKGKSTIWLTISPDDTKQFQILFFALGCQQSAPYKDQVPFGNLRFDLLAERPAAAALQFERVLKLIMKFIIGWDEKEKKPLKAGGIFGIPEAWIRVIQEQSRLTLHGHFEIWIVGHADLGSKFTAAILNELKQSGSMVDQFKSAISSLNNLETDTSSRCRDIEKVVPLETECFSDERQTMESDKSKEIVRVPKEVQESLDRLKKNLECFVLSELELPVEEMDFLLRCFKPGCVGRFHVKSHECLRRQRKKHHIGDTEVNSLECSVCSSVTSVSSQLEKMLDSGFNRCFSRSRLSEDEVTFLIWKGLPEEPHLVDSPLEHDRWLLQLASIHLAVNLHDWRHRSSCFKNGRNECRYKLPKEESLDLIVCLIRQIELSCDNPDSNSEVKPYIHENPIQLLVQIKKLCPFIFLTDCNRRILQMLRCNNCVRYVENQKLSMYCAGYMTKYSSENEKSTLEVLRCISNYIQKINKREAAKVLSNEKVCNILI